VNPCGDPERMTSTETPGERLCRLLLPLHTTVRATARRLCQSPADGDDLLHEAVLHALSRIAQLRDESRFRGWFYAVMLSVHRARSRRAFWRRFVPFFAGEEVPPGSHSGRAESPLTRDPVPSFSHPDEETRTRAARVSAALGTLPAVQREAIVLFEVEGFAIDEIAELQRVSQSAVKSRLLRARERLRSHYQALCQDDEDGGLDAKISVDSGTKLIAQQRGSGT
jgi:RNA polymerase sigma-70 factor, ECF subfamily